MDEYPTKFGRYELLERIAIGGMAQIYRARLHAVEGTSKELVIKRVLPHLAQNRDFIDMFIDEARIAMPLNHGNIVQVFEFGQEGNDYFLAMEYVNGRNLESIMDRLNELGDNMPVHIGLYIASEVAKGLDFAHRFKGQDNRPAGIIHRDVSPQNVLVGFQGQVKLTDFGIAKAKSRIRQTAAGIIQGKACYLSPEQAECRTLDHRSDQFSLAIVIYEMLTGVRPFEGESEVATLDRVRSANVEPPSSRRAGIPPSVEQAVLKALSRDPNNRFRSMADFQVVLSRTLHELAPDFTSVSLGEWLQNMFSRELDQEQGGYDTKQRMARRLAAEGVDVDPVMRTEELLSLGTVAIKSQDDVTPGATQDARDQPFGEISPVPPPGETGDRDSGNKSRGLSGKLKLFMLIMAIGAALWFGIPPLRDLMLGAEPLFPSGKKQVQSSQKADNPADNRDNKSADTAENAGKKEHQQNNGEQSGKTVTLQKNEKRFGFLNLNASPWAYVTVNGRKLKQETPLFKVRVDANKKLEIRFFNPKLKLVKTKYITVSPGQTKSVTVILAEP
ncbi:MAG: protein kinase [Deltaproteobacteria bacterium]|nr:protein kinase [Deltaproteobacteria bacterium]